MLEAPVGYKIMFTFDMPDGSKNGGITTNPDALLWIWRIYREHDGQNLVIKDESIYTNPSK